MKTNNQLLFEDLDETHYTTTKTAEKEFPIFKNDFKNVLGYDAETDGSAALQKGHQREALKNELPMTIVLKDNGHAVILLSEVGNGKHPDALVDGILSEFKQVQKLTIRALKEDFYEARKKGAKKIVLEIKVDAERTFLFDLLRRIAHNSMVNELQDVFLIFNNTLEKLTLKDLK
jgi:hypothetical protein